MVMFGINIICIILKILLILIKNLKPRSTKLLFLRLGFIEVKNEKKNA